MGMAIGHKLSKSLLTCGQSKLTQPTNQPRPNSWKLVRKYDNFGWSVVELNYPNCTNYEGNKILVFNRPFDFVVKFNKNNIDPHFSNSKEYIHPIARFEPTETGWLLARLIVDQGWKTKDPVSLFDFRVRQIVVAVIEEYENIKA